jgi:hypothetical protein
MPAVLEEAAGPAALDVPNWPRWVDRNFSFSYPRGLKEVQDLNYGKPPLPRAGAGKCLTNGRTTQLDMLVPCREATHLR